jgi:hypothetical protein
LGESEGATEKARRRGREGKGGEITGWGGGEGEGGGGRPAAISPVETVRVFTRGLQFYPFFQKFQ